MGVSARKIKVRMRTLHGGRQEGVFIVDIDTGAMRISVIPTRGMNVLEAVAGIVRIGWNSPVSEVVNPAHSSNSMDVAVWVGLKVLMRWSHDAVMNGLVGHPGMDKGVLLPLHGLTANIPASKVVLSIDESNLHHPTERRLEGMGV